MLNALMYEFDRSDQSDVEHFPTSRWQDQPAPSGRDAVVGPCSTIGASIGIDSQVRSIASLATKSILASDMAFSSITQACPVPFVTLFGSECWAL